MLQLPCSYTRKRQMANCLLQAAGCLSSHLTSVTTLQARIAATGAKVGLLPFTGAGHFVTSSICCVHFPSTIFQISIGSLMSCTAEAHSICCVQRSPAIQLEVSKLDFVHQQQTAMLLQLQLCVAAQVALNSHDGQAHTRIGSTQ